MADNHELATYAKLAEAANFYLNESFHYSTTALQNDFAGLIFSKLVDKIDPTDNDHNISKEVSSPENHIEFLQKDFGEVLSEETINKMAEAWHEAQMLSKSKNFNFPKSHSVSSIEILGHITNLAFFVETLTNRHLLFLKQTSAIDSFSYNQLSLSKVLNRLVYICRNELETNKIQFNEITNFFSLRNKTVHYTPDNAISLRTDISSLIRIWEQIHKLLILFEKREKFNEDNFSTSLAEYKSLFINTWTK